jgi:hypothetical protein
MRLLAGSWKRLAVHGVAAVLASVVRHETGEVTTPRSVGTSSPGHAVS